MTADDVARYPLLRALLERRSRRCAAGVTLGGGPLAFESALAPSPLTLEQQAVLAFAGAGVTGHALGDLPYASGPTRESGGGNMMAQFVGRTAASADALHVSTLFVLDDDGAWMIKRPQDHARRDLPALIDAARDGRFVELYERTRVRIATRRPDLPREVPFVAPFNKWSANLPGTSYFLPVSELTAFYINFLLTLFDDDLGFFVLDDRQRYQPAGLARFARSRGGHLHHDPGADRTVTIGVLESWLAELAAIEQGGILQNLALAAEALGIGGFPHLAAHPYAWMQALGFRMHDLPVSRTAGLGPLFTGLLRLTGRDRPMPTPVGLERDGRPLIRPYCPPYYPDMRAAVLAFIDTKYATGTGVFRDGGAVTGFRDAARVQQGIPRYSDRTIDATIAYCEYVHQRYGRFPAANGPFRTTIAYQAHHLDPAFYARHYRAECLGSW